MKEDLHQSLQSVIDADKPTVRKSIIIGLGGSGMKGILSAKSWIEENIPLEAHRYMRWVGIDTTDIETSIEGKGGRYRFPTAQFEGEERRMLYISAPTPSELSIPYLRKLSKEDPAYDWLPNPDVYDISTRAGQGANQTRALGRLAFFFNEEKIRDILIKERDRLTELSDHPKYFQLLDVKEGRDKKEEWLEFEIKPGVNRYNFYDKVPRSHTILTIEPDEKARALLMPHTTGKLTIKDFPRDESGIYFEVPGDFLKGQKLRFHVRHFQRMGQISIFLTASIVGGTGNGMIMDFAAMVRDIFKDHWPPPRIYGILVLPSAFKRVVYNRNARANSYAALKEIDYFMSGNPFKAQYPSGRKVVVEERLFNDGMLYLLDVSNMASNSLQGRDQVQDLTGQFISTFIASTVGGAIEERMVNDSTRASIFLPKGERSPRRASYNSFGISRVLYPVPQLKTLGFEQTAVSIIEQFLKPFSGRLLLETMGDLNRGVVRALRIHCRLIFERLYPDYRTDMQVEFRSYKLRLKKALQKKDLRGTVSLLENIQRDYGKAELEKMKEALLRRMHKRSQVELRKIDAVLGKILHKFLKDPKRGFPFCEMMLNLILEKLEVYQKKYYQEKVGLARYDDAAFDDLLEKLGNASRGKGKFDSEMVSAFVHMADFNYRQLVFETMLQAAEDFIRGFKALIYEKKNNEVSVLRNKLEALKQELEDGVKKVRFELLEKKNPLFFYLINEEEIQKFLQEFFSQRLSLDDLCSEVDFVTMDSEDDLQQIIETYLIYSEGLEILDKSPEEMKELIDERFRGLLSSEDPETIKAKLREDMSGGEGLALSDTSSLRVEIQSIKSKLYKVINKRFEGLNFENISIKNLLDEKKIPVRKLLEKLDHYSRPYIYINAGGLQSMEYYRTVTNFKLDTYEEGDDPETMTPNDLPSRLDHYVKRSSASPNISVETFTVPNLCKPYEMISIGILLGYPIFKIDSLNIAARDYHALVAEKSHPLHLFNAPGNDAKFFPDPFRTMNYLNPAHLWAGLVALKVLQQSESGYAFEAKIHKEMKDMEARENYKKTVAGLAADIEAAGGFDSASSDVLCEAAKTLALLARNPARKTLQFRREYSLAIRDILDGDDTETKALAQNMSKEQYIEKFVENPQFNDMGELAVFLDNEPLVREFLSGSIKDIVDATSGNEEAGAVIQLPAWKSEKTELPVFKDKYAFFDYFEKRGSLEWQNFLKDRLVAKLHQTVSGSRFRLEQDPTLPDRNKIGSFLAKLDNRMPEVVLWEVKVMNKIIS